MPDFLLILVGALVPILALTLAFACARAREPAGESVAEVSSEARADEACS